MTEECDTLAAIKWNNFEKSEQCRIQDQLYVNNKPKYFKSETDNQLTRISCCNSSSHFRLQVVDAISFQIK